MAQYDFDAIFFMLFKHHFYCTKKGDLPNIGAISFFYPNFGVLVKL